MKKLILLLAFIIPVLCSAQWVFEQDSMSVPAGTDTTWYIQFYTPTAWSVQFNYRNFDDVDATLGIYACSEPDSTLYDLFWLDQNLDGVNDNPFTLADSSITFVGNIYPVRKLLFKLTKGSVTSGLKLYYWYTK